MVRGVLRSWAAMAMALLGSTAASSPAAALVVASFDAGGGISPFLQVPTGVHLFLSISAPGHEGDPGNPRIFDSLVFTPSDVGGTFFVDQSADPDFDDFVALLTNGLDDKILAEHSIEPEGASGSGASGQFESLWVGDDVGATDLAAFEITRIGLTIDSLSLPAGLTGTFSYSGTYDFIEAVPEPSTDLLFVVATSALAVVATRKRAGGEAPIRGTSR